MTTQHRSPESLDHSRLWDKGVVESTNNERIELITFELAHEDMKKRADQLMREFKPVTPYPYSSSDIRDKFFQKAREKALEILEIERKSFVEYRSKRIKNVLNTIIKRLRYMVFEVDKKGKVSKLKKFIEHMPKQDSSGNWIDADVQYVGDHDTQRLEQILRVTNRLSAFNDYAPYFNKELSSLWKEANGIAHLETVRVQKNKPLRLPKIEPIDIGADS